MFATVAVTPPAVHGSAGTFDVQSLVGASCIVHRTGGGQSNLDLPAYTVQPNGHAVITRGQSWPAAPAPGYSITATCSLAGRPTVTSPVVKVIWP
jgi:hypothetical protein